MAIFSAFFLFFRSLFISRISLATEILVLKEKYDRTKLRRIVVFLQSRCLKAQCALCIGSPNMRVNTKGNG
jgi:hypothetical protein